MKFYSLKKTARLVWLALALAAYPTSSKSDETGVWVDFSTKEWQALESSIDKGLEWIAAQANRNGSIGVSSASAQPAHTALATMAFLSRGHQPGQGPHGKMLERAIDYVLSTQDQYGFFIAGSNYKSGGASYSHAIAGVMLAEAIGMVDHTRNEKITNAIRLGINATIKLQMRHANSPVDRGGWRYVTRNAKTDADLSVSTWHLLFLRAAKNANFNVPEQTVMEASDYVRRCFNPVQNQFTYLPGRSGTITMTGAGTLSLFLAGQYDDPMAKRGLKKLQDYNFMSVGKVSWPYYTCYHCSQAASQAGPTARKKILREITTYLLGTQSSNGSWPKSRDSSTTGPCYATPMAILALTPSYQILPIYQQ